MREHGYKGQTWPQELIDTLIGLHQKGCSAGRVAELMGMSRNAVIGKAWRLGLSFMRDPRPTVPKPRPPTIRQLGALNEGRLLQIKKAIRAKKEKDLIKQLPTKQNGECKLEGLKWNCDGVPANCRAIMNNEMGINALYCGKEVYKRSYCYAHFRKFYCVSREEQRQRSAEGQ